MAKFIRLNAYQTGIERETPPADIAHVHKNWGDDDWIEENHGDNDGRAWMRLKNLKITHKDEHGEAGLCVKVYLNLDSIVEVCNTTEVHSWRADDDGHPSQPGGSVISTDQEEVYERAMIRTYDGSVLHVIGETAGQVITRMEAILNGETSDMSEEDAE